MHRKDRIPEKNPATLKVMTYNIHSCINVRGNLDPKGIIRVITAFSPDVVALQEVEKGRFRSNFLDQPNLLADALGMRCDFFPLVFNGEEKYGLAILSCCAVKKVKFEVLAVMNSTRNREPRGAMWIKLLTDVGKVNFVNTHLALYRRDRLIQIRTLLGNRSNSGIARSEPLILCGDMNATPYSPVYREISGHLTDVQKKIRQKGYPKNTFHSLYPLIRLDHIFISDHFVPVRVNVPDDYKSRMASDHLPVFAVLAFKGSPNA
jgi:endonuclease/exonuclease/phosphatase family metal-dependent hydrolase